MVGRGHALIVLDEDLLQLKNYLGTSVHGILGYELFSRFIVEINYSTKEVIFHDPDYFKLRRKFYRYDLEVIDTKPYLNVDFSLKDTTKQSGRFMVDTGASHSFLLDRNANSNFLVPEPSIYSHLGRGLGGEMFGFISRINQVSMKPFSFQDVITTIPDTANYNIDIKRTPRAGTIGGGLLSRFVVVFDYVHEALYLKKNKSYKNPFEYNLSGLIIKATGLRLDAYEIVEVRDGCSAQIAGVLAGDEIIIINGQFTKDLNLNQVLGLINLRANKSIRLIVMRNGVKTKLFFRLERQV
jgi:aspartyl protease